MVENFIVIQLIFAEIFVPQDFTIRAGHGFMGPAHMCAVLFTATQDAPLPDLCKVSKKCRRAGRPALEV